jgi:hypothetical protein
MTATFIFEHVKHLLPHSPRKMPGITQIQRLKDETWAGFKPCTFRMTERMGFYISHNKTCFFFPVLLG